MAQVALASIERLHLFAFHVESAGERDDDRLLPEPELDRLPERRDPALEQVGDHADLVGVDAPEQLGENVDELAAARRLLQALELNGQVGEAQHGSTPMLPSVGTW